MTPAVATAFAAAFASMVRQETTHGRAREGTIEPVTICLGRDSRPSGDMLARAAAAGVLSTGCGLIDLGVVATPTVGFAVRRLGAAGGLVVTASHNPIAWNGLKCLDGGGAAPPKAKADRILACFREGAGTQVDVHGLRQASSDDSIWQRHVEEALGLVDVQRIRRRGFSVVLDSVNGAGGPAGRLLLDRLGCTTLHLGAEPTGLFGHAPEPIESNLGDLCQAVRKTNGQVVCGFAQDPDADRLAIVDEQGRYIGEEYTLVLAAHHLLQRRGPTRAQTTLVANLSTSRMIDDLARRHGHARVLRTAVGEANVVEAMRAESALIGGEGNGGVIVPQVCWVRDSLSAMALTLDLLAAEERPLGAIVAELPRYEMIKHKFELSELPGARTAQGGEVARRGRGGAAAAQGLQASAEGLLAPLLERVDRAFSDQRLDRTDGLRVDFDDGWVHLRPSNTEPIVRLIAEAPTRERAWELLDEVAVAAGMR